ncbi:hypothetical protein E7T09_16235 [Deinococcus sp. KSM4-11]|uniref:hypothetical protein n=1 Tax=Deinococcus sp. KSM4-11 TaxID=2568654 RepID=UPI0010A35C9B|nr:hypothetical protein [Deinococcus sp. KSM4-11]THF85504.1 hypothetical protein E7T09_16235 [Deinococcus sp. KSM4-11]
MKPIDVRDLRVLRVRALQLAAAEGLTFGPALGTTVAPALPTVAATPPVSRATTALPPTGAQPPKAEQATDPATASAGETTVPDFVRRRVRVTPPVMPEVTEAAAPAEPAPTAPTKATTAQTPDPAEDKRPAPEDTLALPDFSDEVMGSELDAARAGMAAMLQGTLGAGVTRGVQRARDQQSRK